jgi:quercetin dioxygenase-like cupin family protein
MNPRRAGFAALAVLSAAAGGWLVSNAETSPATATPQVSVLLENERVRVREIVLPAGAATGQHTHQVPELSYSFTDGPIQVSVPGAEPVVEQWVAGQARWRDAGVTHDVRNIGSADMRVIVIDVK